MRLVVTTAVLGVVLGWGKLDKQAGTLDRDGLVDGDGTRYDVYQLPAEQLDNNGEKACYQTNAPQLNPAWYNATTGTYVQFPKRPKPHRWPSPKTVTVGCIPSRMEELCWFFARVFTREVFPDSEMHVVQLNCTRDFSPDGDVTPHDTCEQPDGHRVDILWGAMGCHAEGSIKMLRTDAPLTTSAHPPGYDDGVFWTPNKVRSHEKQRPFIVEFEYEQGVSQVADGYDLLMSHWNVSWTFANSANQAPVIWTPETWRDFAYRWMNTPNDLFVARGAEASPVLRSTVCKDRVLNKTDFMAFMHDRCYKFQYHTADFLIRAAFFDEVAATYKAAEALAGCRMQNGSAAWLAATEGYASASQMMPLQYNVKQGSDTFADEAVGAFERFRFTIVMQNSHVSGGTQEKIAHAWLARSIPVYFGPYEAVQHYNPESFINCEFGDSVQDLEKKLKALDNQMALQKAKWTKSGQKAEGIEFDHSPEFEALLLETRRVFSAGFGECVRKVKEIDQDEAKFMKMVNAPVLDPAVNELPLFEMSYYAKRFRAALKNANSYLVE